MIINSILYVIYNLLNILLVFEIPQLPTEVTNYINQFFDYLVTGASIVANYIPLSYLFVLFGIILAVDVGIQIYHFVMWIIRKIPMLSVS